MTVWRDVVPGDIAQQQDAWEYRKRIALIHRTWGGTVAETSRRIGLSRSYVHQLLIREERERMNGQVSPVEAYLNTDNPFDARGATGPKARKMMMSSEAVKNERCLRWADLIRVKPRRHYKHLDA